MKSFIQFAVSTVWGIFFGLFGLGKIFFYLNTMPFFDSIGAKGCPLERVQGFDHFYGFVGWFYLWEMTFSIIAYCMGAFFIIRLSKRIFVDPSRPYNTFAKDGRFLLSNAAHNDIIAPFHWHRDRSKNRDDPSPGVTQGKVLSMVCFVMALLPCFINVLFLTWIVDCTEPLVSSWAPLQPVLHLIIHAILGFLNFGGMNTLSKFYVEVVYNVK